jgi:hypothetical protein
MTDEKPIDLEYIAGQNEQILAVIADIRNELALAKRDLGLKARRVPDDAELAALQRRVKAYFESFAEPGNRLILDLLRALEAKR